MQLLPRSSFIPASTAPSAVTVTAPLEPLAEPLEILGFLAVVMATINVVGGFLVTHRMLDMFKKKD